MRKEAKAVSAKCAVSEKYESCSVHQDCHVADKQKQLWRKRPEYQEENTNWRHLYASMQAAQTPANNLGISSGLSHMIKRAVCTRCGRLLLLRRRSLRRYAAENCWRKGQQKLEKRSLWRERYRFDKTMFYENRFWNRRPDGIVINKNHRSQYILSPLPSRLMPLSSSG